MNERPDLEAPQPVATSEIARVYEWAGKPLFPFSVGRHCALQRLRVVSGSQMEAAAALVRLCQLTPAEVSRIRESTCEKFHVELSEWMDANGIGLGAKRRVKTAALIALYDEILEELYDAEKITTEGGGGASGNG